VNEFVEECRGEWKRLGVPDHVAAEMAADLEADLDEAEAEGASAEDVLGSGAFDARSFAAAWAAERGVIQRPPRSRRGFLQSSRLPAALGTAALVVTIVGAALVILASPSGPREGGVWVAGPREGAVWVAVTPRAATPEARMVAVGSLDPRVDTADSSDDTRTIGSILLVVGLAGVVPLMLLALWASPGRWPRRSVTTAA
jgi:hypothetical protein